MNISNKVTINKSATEVWNVLSNDFDKVYQWMAPVYKSYKIEGEEPISGAQMAGRICEFTTKEGGFYAEERITQIDNDLMTMTVMVEPKNAPAALPLVKNTLNIQVKVLAEGKSEVLWDTNPELKTIGKIMKPLLRMGLSKSFVEVLEELKYFMESGEQHPRKYKKALKVAA